MTPGAIRYLRPSVYTADPGTILTWNLGGPDTTKVRPWVCVGAHRGWTAWTALTTVARPERLWLRSEWIVGGSVTLRTTHQYLRDAGQVMVIHEGTLGRASSVDPATFPPALTDEGVAAVLAEVDRQRARRPFHADLDHTLRDFRPRLLSDAAGATDAHAAHTHS